VAGSWFSPFWMYGLYLQGEKMSLLITLLVVFVLLGIGGGFGYSRFGYAGFSPAGLLLIVLIVLYFTGHLRFN